MTPGEFDRWYWSVADLRAGATALGVPSHGLKSELSARIRAALAGSPLPTSTARFSTDGLTGDLDLDTPIPAGQRLTRRLREFMVEHCGTGFRFTAEMREFFAGDAERTLGDAVQLWVTAQAEPRKTAPIADQFEYNRFHRAWRVAHPGGSHAEMVAAWRHHRNRPRDR